MMPAVPLAASGPTTIDFPGGWRTDWSTLQLVLSNIPSGVAGVGSTLLFDAHGNSWTPASLSNRASTSNPGTSATLTDRYVPGVATGMTYTIELEWSNGSYSTWSKTIDGIVEVDARDVTATLLPAVTSRSISDVATQRPSISWTTSAPLSDASIGVAGMSWNGIGSWMIEFAGDTMPPIQLPQLPDAMLKLLPPISAQFPVSLGPLRFSDLSYRTSYDEARQKPTGPPPANYESRVTQ